MDEKLKLVDGTVLEGRTALSADDLILYIIGMSLADGYPLLSDEAKVKKIIADSFGEITIYTGFVHLFFIREEMNGLLTAGLRKVEANG